MRATVRSTIRGSLNSVVTWPCGENMAYVDINSAMNTVRRLTQPGHDRAYFDTHEPRFRRAGQRVTEIAPRGSCVLDLGSHYVHLAAILRLLGYELVALDVSVFQKLQFVRARAETLRIRTATTESAAAGYFLLDSDNRFDIVAFCEMFEHITLNPCEFWNVSISFSKLVARCTFRRRTLCRQ
jgi:2-polyprenyl-3-methyl-5-hydroxy-6-metoxy-1,4-benzoquinol methylase